MFQNTRAAKRRKTTSDYNTSVPAPPSPPANRRTSRRSLQSRDPPKSLSRNNAEIEQSPLDDADELGEESTPPAAAKRPSRNKRPSSRAASNATYVDTPVTKPGKNSTPRSSKAAASKPSPLKAKPSPSPGSDLQNEIVDTPISSKQGRTRRRSNYTDVAFNGGDSAGDTTLLSESERNLSRPETNTITLPPDPVTEAFKLVVLDKLAGKRGNALLGLDDERQKVHSLLHQTVTAGEGNSMLIIGSRGSGKSTMVNGLLQELSQKHREHFLTIRLNGFIHTDDKLALRDIWRQLGREMDVEEDGHAHNYADTLAKLLAVLSHPAELSSEVDPDKVAKSVIFILDEFDLFASHPRQTLLYNLFDVAQSRKAPIAVLGLTTRVDIAESLEKRVKSRFSHRYVYLSTAKSVNEFKEICRSKLRLEPEDLTLDERLQFYKPPETPAKKTKKRLGSEPASTAASTLLTAWNDSVDALFLDAYLSTHLANIYHTTRSIPTALTSMMFPVSQLSAPVATNLNLALLTVTMQPDSKLFLLPSLPTLALALLIAAARLDVTLDTDLCNFNMAYDEYVAQTAKARIAASTASAAISTAAVLGSKVWSRDTARTMWEKLAQLELLVPATNPRLDTAVVILADTDMVKCDVALEEIEGAVPDLDKGLAKWCREI